MKNKEKPPIPEKCCATCGFLYGVCRYSYQKDELFFDPDLIRSQDYPPPSHDAYGSSKPGFISSSFFTEKSIRNKGDISYEFTDAIGYTWADTFSINCYWNVFNPRRLHELHETIDFRETAKNYLPLECDDFLDLIRKDRSDCEHYFRYYPRISPSRHAELQIEEKRLETMREHEQKLVEWSNQQEKRLRMLALDAEGKLNDLQRSITWKLGVLGLIIAILAAILQPVFTYLLEIFKPFQ